MTALRKPIALGLFALYLVLLLYSTLVYHTEGRVPPATSVNLVPFRTVRHFLRVGGWEMVVNVAGNLVALVPVGLVLPALRGDRSSAREAALAGLALSTAIELAQFASGRRIADLDDVVLNTVGAVLGYGLFVACARLARWRPVRLSRRPAA